MKHTTQEHFMRPPEGRDSKETEMNALFTRIETQMLAREFLAENPVIVRAEAKELGAEALVEVLCQYVRLPEEIVTILREAADWFVRSHPVQRELARNIAEESGYGTGGVAHVEILKHMLQRDLQIDARNVTGSPATEQFIVQIRKGMRKNASFALGQAFALEASAVPELSRVVGPVVNATARAFGKSDAISVQALQESGEYKLPTIRNRKDAMDMSADDWFALHIKDFEIGHRDLLRHHANTFLMRDGSSEEFEAGFVNVMNLMDAWWSALAA